MSKVYEVYICKYGDEVIYIGQGEKGRHKHCFSGTSHVYGLNELHFKGDNINMTCDVLKLTADKDEAVRIEKELIIRYRPRLNSVYITSHRGEKANCVLSFKVDMKSVTPNTETWYNTRNGKKFLSCLDEFIKFHHYSEYLGDNFKLKYRGIYHELGFNNLANLKRTKYDPNGVGWKDLFKTGLLKYTSVVNVT